MQRINGARLEFVVKKLPGTVQREVCEWEPGPVNEKTGKSKGGKIVRKMVTQPAGHMVYFPRGHALRLSEEDLKKYRLHRKPRIINLQGLADPNSPIGQMLHSQNEEERQKGYINMEQAVIRLATAKSGALLSPEQIGRRPRVEVAPE